LFFVRMYKLHTS